MKTLKNLETEFIKKFSGASSDDIDFLHKVWNEAREYQAEKNARLIEYSFDETLHENNYEDTDALMKLSKILAEEIRNQFKK